MLYSCVRPPASVPMQLTGKGTIEKYCTGNTICVLALLPGIAESGKKGREDYLSTYTQTLRMSMVHGKKFAFLWSEGGAQLDMEKAFGLSFGYPALAAFNV